MIRADRAGELGSEASVANKGCRQGRSASHHRGVLAWVNLDVKKGGAGPFSTFREV
jgi:hypothetical protein